jgi:hypothetical protein
MQLGKDILRGVRMAAIVFAILLITLTSYRMLRVAPASTPQAEKPLPVAAPHPAVAAGAPAVPANAEVPPPPPPVARQVRRATRTPVVHTAPVAVLTNVEAVLTPEAAAPEPEPVPTPVVAAPEQKPAPLESPAYVQEPAPSPAANPEVAPQAAPRKKGLLRSMGRFLRVGGKKDQPAETAKP